MVLQPLPNTLSATIKSMKGSQAIVSTAVSDAGSRNSRTTTDTLRRGRLACPQGDIPRAISDYANDRQTSSFYDGLQSSQWSSRLGE